MFYQIKVGWRNIIRYRRRSLVTISTVISGVTGIVLFGGYVQANYTGLRESVIRSQYGHMQVYKSGYEKNHRASPNSFRLNEQEITGVSEILSKNPKVIAFGRRIEFTGVLGNDTVSHAAMVRAVDPESETMINSALTIVDGNDLDSGEMDGALVGEGLAQAVNAHIGDSFTMLAPTTKGSLNAIDLKITGIFKSISKEFDDNAMMISLDYAKILLNTSEVDHIVVLLSDTSMLGEFDQWLQSKTSEKKLSLEFKRWYDLAGFYHSVVNLYNGFFFFISILVVIIVFFGISNTMAMAVMERTVEIGILRALGTRQSRIIKQFLVEGTLLGVIGSILGIILGIILAYVITSFHIMMPPPPGTSQEIPLIIENVPFVWISGLLGVWLISILASIIPAASAARKMIVDALRYV